MSSSQESTPVPTTGFVEIMRSLFGYLVDGPSTTTLNPMFNTDVENKSLGSSQTSRPQKRKRDEAQEHDEPSVRPRRGSVSICVTPTTESSAPKPVPSTELHSQGYYNRRGDQYLRSSGTVIGQEKKHQFAPEFKLFPEVGKGYANSKGALLDEEGNPVFFITDDDL
jgi:hypothetical protein